MATKVKKGSPCHLKYQGKMYLGKILEVRGKSKMFKVSFTDKKGRVREVWRGAHELGPASPDQADAMPMRIEILPKVGGKV